MRKRIIYLLLLSLSLDFLNNPIYAQDHRHYDSHRNYDSHRDYYRDTRVVYSNYYSYPRHAPYYPVRYPYYYPSVYYRPFYSVDVGLAFPSIGIHVTILPRGYRTIMVGGWPYFYYNGVFYRKDKSDYEVINAPVGADVPELPEGAKVVVIDNNKYFEYKGTYYRENIRDNGEIWYTVIGKDGVVNTMPTAPATGSVLTSLPPNCKVLVLNGQKYYVSPDGTYYQEIIENNQVLYKVAGAASTN